MKLHPRLLKNPMPIEEDCEDGRWKHFKNCLGALDGMLINCHVCNEDRGRYRTRKNNISMIVLGVCTPNMEFILIMPGREGSSYDGRVLRHGINHPNGLKVPQGSYYLVDDEYTNRNGFLAPFRGHQYNLKEWGSTTNQCRGILQYEAF